MSVQPDLEHRIAEVVESSSALFVAQCYELYETPPLGTLVRAGENPVTYGVITKITTLGTDPTRRPVARGATELNESAVYANNPQLSRLLRTDFETVIVGYGDGGDIKHYLPPIPPRIHAFVYTLFKNSAESFPLISIFPSEVTSQTPTLFLTLVASRFDASNKLSLPCL